MYKILLVDDNGIEREGIKFLIEKYAIDLEVFEEENGAKALEFLSVNPVDIILTDIKMPFVDGLELIQRSRVLYPKVKAIIFSAYSDFEYAQKAIENKAISYMLKPIVVDEFLRVINSVIQICDDEKKSEIIFDKALVYEKDQILIDLLGVRNKVDCDRAAQLTKLDFSKYYITLLLINIREKFFEYRNDEFRRYIKALLTFEYEYINLNEHQSVVFLCIPYDMTAKDELIGISEKIIETLLCFSINPFLVFSRPVRNYGDFAAEYELMEQKSDMRYFSLNETVIFLSEPDYKNSLSSEMLDNILNDIDKAVDEQDVDYVIMSIHRLFEMLKNNNHFSSLYVKFICANIVKRKAHMAGIDSEPYVLDIFKKNDVVQLEDEVIKIISQNSGVDRTHLNEANNKVKKQVLDIIQNEYMNDISLEYIAEKIYLTPSYLSYLFKKMTGYNVFKYLTSYRLKKAEELVRQTNMKIIDVGKKVGYSNLSYFCMLFKNSYGMTPAKYRAEKR